MNNIQVPTMTTPGAREMEQTPEQVIYSETELTKQRLIHLKNNTDPQKWVFIEEIKKLAEQQNDFSHSTLDAIVRNSQKTIKDLFYIKYELSLTGLIVTDLLINFRDISKRSG